MKSLLASLLFLACLPLAAQTSYEELEFEMDSTSSVYRPTSKNYVLLKSKRGSSGMNKTAAGDAVINSEVSEIVLVFSETEASDLAEREDANRERWENLLKTYPELFQFSTTYKTVCQCKVGGDAESLKASQGFYVYVNGEVPKVEEAPKVAEEKPAAPAKPAVTEEKKPVAKTAEEKPAAPAKADPAPVKESAPVAPKTENTVAKPKEAPVVEKTPEPVVEKTVSENKPVQVAEEPKEKEEEAPVAPVAKKSPSKKPAASAKPRRAKDPKACRQPCYGFGDEDLVAFFKDNIKLSKKQRRKAKNWVANVRLQINHDGTIKKAMVTGGEESFNEMVNSALKSMNPWNSAVKNGLAVKSEVRFNLKYDKSTKAIRPSDFIMNPKASPKCPCVTDGEMFD